MLPVGHGKGEIWRQAQYLCDAEYVISPPLDAATMMVQRVLLPVEEEHCLTLLDAYDLVLVLADGSRYPIPRPIKRNSDGALECYVESYHR